MSKKRIVIFSWAESVHLGRWAHGLAKRGHDIKVISLGGEPLENIETVNFSRNSKFSYYMHSGPAAREARKFDPDLVHVHYAGGYGIWGMASKISPMVVSVWGSDVTELPSKWFNKFIIKRTLQRADKITATSKYLKQLTTELMPKTQDKIEVIPFGVTVPDSFTPLPELDPLKLCFIKVHFPVYGPEILLKAVYEIKKVIPEVQLTIAGNGILTDQMKQQTVELGLEKNVTFAGFVNNKDIYEFVGKHHLMLMPSYKEAFGVAVLESAACGRASVASDVGGVPEVLQHNRTGRLVPVGDYKAMANTVIELAGDKNKLAQLGQEAYNFVKAKYDWERSLDMMEELYDKVLYEKKK